MLRVRLASCSDSFPDRAPLLAALFQAALTVAQVAASFWEVILLISAGTCIMTLHMMCHQMDAEGNARSGRSLMAYEIPSAGARLEAQQ